MPWAVCKWDAETDRVIVVGAHPRNSRSAASTECFDIAEKEGLANYDSDAETLWCPATPENIEKTEVRGYLKNLGKGKVELYEVSVKFTEAGYITSAFGEVLSEKLVAQYFPLKIPNTFCASKTNLESIPEEDEERPPTPTVPPPSPKGWDAVVGEMKLVQRARRLKKKTKLA